MRIAIALLIVTLTLLSGMVMGIAGIYLYLDPQVPDAATYREIRLQTPLRVFTADGRFIAEFGERRRIPLRMEEFPEPFVRAVLDTEDKRFYSHKGIDYIPLIRSMILLLANPGEIPPGGSTITMQLARNISFTLEQTFLRKFKEMLLAVKLERELTKDEILELYLNVIPFGKRAYGAEAAALTYYGKPLAELDVAQWAMLAGIPQAPSIGNPVNGPERALRRRNLVLANMLEQGSIDRATYETSVARPITATVHDRLREVDAPWVAEWARQEVLALYGTGAYEDGLEVYTTIDSRDQLAANAAVRAGLTAYDRRHGYRGPERVLDGPTGEGPLDVETLEAWRLAVAETPTVGDERPAAVLSVGEAGFEALLGDGTRIEVPLEHLRWARPYIDVNTRGRRPDTPGDLVTSGQLVRVTQREDGWHLGQLPEVQGALVALHPADGAIRALVGGFDFDANQFNHATQATRQPGSNFKPFVYAAALDAGITPASIYMDAPLVFEDDNLEGLYRPKNDNGNFGGPTRLRTALYRSVNLVSMRVLLDVGAGRVIDYASRFGFDTRTFPRNLQLAIGGGTMALTPLDMARAFAVFANGGYRVDPWLVERVIRNGDGELYVAQPPTVCDAACEADEARRLSAPDAVAASASADEPAGEVDAEARADAEAPPDAEGGAPQAPSRARPKAPRAIDARVAYIMDSLLGDVIRYGTGRRARSLERGDLAGKTGTTNAADTWFSGYQRELAATVWVGFSDNRPLGDNEFGSNAALPIWIDLMDTALAGVPEYRAEQPPGIVQMPIDPATGLAALPNQDDSMLEIFLAEHAPVPADTVAQEPEASPESIF
ncbi:MAG: PBP1A family penicillin-binding protein [Pseudomonadales bacterium]|jgi:penicillin-binding protein 1A|nr:PBP1A family penicillin-binding protein [Pseudomonadales bacterium]